MNRQVEVARATAGVIGVYLEGMEKTLLKNSLEWYKAKELKNQCNMYERELRKAKGGGQIKQLLQGLEGLKKEINWFVSL